MIILHGTRLSFELIDVPVGEPGPERMRPAHDTLLRVVEGTVRLEVDGAERVLTIEDEARVPAGAVHRVRNEGAAARVLYELRSARSALAS